MLSVVLLEDPKPLNSGISFAIEGAGSGALVSIVEDEDTGGVIGGGEPSLLTLDEDRRVVGVAVLPF